MQRDHQERIAFSPAPVPQRTAPGRPWSHSILHRRQPQSLRLFLQNEPVAVLIQEQLNSLIKWPTSRHNRSHRQTANTLRRCHESPCHTLSHKHILLKGSNQTVFAFTTGFFVIVFSEPVLVTHIGWSVEIHVRSSTVFEYIQSSLDSVLLLIRVHPLRITGPVMNHRRPWRHNTTTVTDQTAIRVVIMTVMESQSSRRRTVPLLDVFQPPLRLTSSTRFNSTMNTSHFLE